MSIGCWRAPSWAAPLILLSLACAGRTANIDNSAPRYPVPPERIRDATPEGVESCTFLAVLTATAMGFGDVGAQHAKENVREEAAERHATHLVWKNVTGGMRGAAEAEAFRCETPSR